MTIEGTQQSEAEAYPCRHCDRRFDSVGEFAKHLMKDHHFGGDLSEAVIDRICFGPL